MDNDNDNDDTAHEFHHDDIISDVCIDWSFDSVIFCFNPDNKANDLDVEMMMMATLINIKQLTFECSGMR